MDQARDELKYSNVKGKNPFKDVRVREAFYRAIDEDTIAKRVMRGQAVPSALLIAPVLFARARRVQAPDYRPQDGQGAAGRGRLPGRLLARHGLPERPLRQRRGDLPGGGLDARPRRRQGEPQRAAQGQVLRQGAGPGLRHLVLPARLDPVLAGLPQHPLRDRRLPEAGDKSGRGTWNLGGYCNPKIDAIADQSRPRPTRPSATPRSRTASTIMQTDWGYIPLHQQALAWGVSKKVDADPARRQPAAALLGLEGAVQVRRRRWTHARLPACAGAAPVGRGARGRRARSPSRCSGSRATP